MMLFNKMHFDSSPDKKTPKKWSTIALSSKSTHSLQSWHQNDFRQTVWLSILLTLYIKLLNNNLFFVECSCLYVCPCVSLKILLKQSNQVHPSNVVCGKHVNWLLVEIPCHVRPVLQLPAVAEHMQHSILMAKRFFIKHFNHALVQVVHEIKYGKQLSGKIVFLSVH